MSLNTNAVFSFEIAHLFRIACIRQMMLTAVCLVDIGWTDKSNWCWTKS